MNDVDTLVGLVEGLSISSNTYIKHDACVIIHCHIESISSDCYCCVPYHLCLLTKHMGKLMGAPVVYNALVCEFRKMGHENELLELMPYIDDYLEYFCKL